MTMAVYAALAALILWIIIGDLLLAARGAPRPPVRNKD